MIASSFQPDFLEPMLMRMAQFVTGTEAFAFSLADFPESGHPQVICHIRPDDASFELKESAMLAARELIREPLREMMDGVIHLGGPTHPNGRQYCLITILRASHSPRRAICVFAIIVRCRDDDEASRRLGTLQGRPIANETSALAPPMTSRFKPLRPRNYSLGWKIAALSLLLNGSLIFLLIILKLT